MNELKEQEQQQASRKKEELALTTPSFWQQIKKTVKEAIAKVSEWNKQRKQEKADREQKKDESIVQEVTDSLSKKTERQKFLDGIDATKVVTTEVQEKIGEQVTRILEEEASKNETKKDETQLGD